MNPQPTSVDEPRAGPQGDEKFLSQGCCQRTSKATLNPYKPYVPTTACALRLLKEGPSLDRHKPETASTFG